MDNPRVFEIANEAGVDIRTAVAALAVLGSSVVEPTTRLDDDLAGRLRHALHARDQFLHDPGQEPSRQTPRGRPVHRPLGLNKQDRQRPTGKPRNYAMFSPLKQVLRQDRTESIRDLIPALFEALLEGLKGHYVDAVIVVHHDTKDYPRYGLCSLSGEPWTPPPGSSLNIRTLLAPILALDSRYLERGWMPPNVYIAMDLANQHVWFGRSIKTLQNQEHGSHLRADTLLPVGPKADGSPPKLALKAEKFLPRHVQFLAALIGVPQDRPEESFLLREELLQLAIDSLGSDEALDPLPVHTNALWVFARPVLMERPDGSARHVRAVWFRQGQAAWRMRTFTAGIRGKPKEVGELLGGRLPFVPVWDQSRPEQKMLAAVWALMTQGGVTESERHFLSEQERSASGQPNDELVVVRVKADTDHARVYRSGDTDTESDRAAWSVRGHWRRQPYPSLGINYEGEPITKLIWIATYRKGDVHLSPVPDKVIVVRP